MEVNKIKKVISTSIKDAKNNYNFKTNYQSTLPVDIKHDDLYIVEFPKSGITWLSFILGNINLMKSNKDQQMTLFNVQQHIPDIHMSRYINNSPLPFPGFRMIKSHSKFNPYYNHVLLLTRNPFDVMVSYYYYLKKQNKFKGDIEQFVKDEKHGIKSWVSHIESWTQNIDASKRIIMVRYEDLKEKPEEEIKNIYSILGFNIDDNTIKKAIELSSFNNMKAQEENYKKRNPNYNLNFIRKGKKLHYKEEMNQKTIDYIHQQSKKYLEKHFNDVLK